MHEIRIDAICKVKKLEAAPFERTRLDFSTGWIGREFPIFRDASVCQRLTHGAPHRIVDEVHEIRRPSIDRNLIRALAGASAPQNWLVIPGQQPVTLPMNDPMGREQALKKLTSLLGPPLSTFDVLELPRQFGRALHNELLGLEERLQCSCMVVRFPTRKVGKLNGFEVDSWAGHGSSTDSLT